MVALGATTANGQTLFAKNSDRPADECQPLVMHSRRMHDAGSTVRLQWLELPEAEVTYRHVGSRPYWCWGYEHGFNEQQVVIGNEGLGSKIEAEDQKLIGMELVRLGLERGRTAAEAVEVMGDLISRYGQGRAKNAIAEGNYDNGFIIADPHEAYVMETAGHHWAVKGVQGATGISNVYSVGADWDRISPEAETDAKERGWWNPDQGRLSFSGAFENPGFNTGEGSGTRRRARSCAMLKQLEGRITPRLLMSLLGDHSDGSTPDEPFRTFPVAGGICYHTENAETGWCGNTAASLVADLCADGSRLPVYWCSFYSPCMGVFFPVFIEGALPSILGVGDAEPSDDSPWWRFHRLSHAARSEGEQGVAFVQERWADFQNSLFDSAYEVAREARRLIGEGQEDVASQLLTRAMDENVREIMDRAGEMLDTLSAKELAKV
jgi:dipeptidase